MFWKKHMTHDYRFIVTIVLQQERFLSVFYFVWSDPSVGEKKNETT